MFAYAFRIGHDRQSLPALAVASVGANLPSNMNPYLDVSGDSCRSEAMMAVPSGLNDFVQMLRSDVERANAINWGSLCKNAKGHVAEILTFAELTPEIAEACDNAVKRCCEYADEIGEKGLLHKPDHPANKQARELALMAVAELEYQLEEAEPSEQARILHIPWSR